MSKELMRQLRNIHKEESRLLAEQENKLMTGKINPLKEKLMEKIPSKLTATLQAAFAKSFQLLYEKGGVIIERTYRKEGKELEHKLLNYALDQKHSRRYFKRMDKQAGQSKLLNTSFSVVEGGVLGFLGIGLPDIPLFIAVVLKSIYEISLSYGFDYKQEEEKYYILCLISTAMAQGEQRINYNDRLDILAGHIDTGRSLKLDLPKQMDKTAQDLAEAMLVAKFIQGIPIVGTVGGIVNYHIIQKISRYARIKYKKRYLLKKLKEEHAAQGQKV